MLRQKVVDYLGVLDADEKAEHAKHAGRHAEIEADTIGVAGPGAGTGSDDHFVTGQIFDQLLDQWEHRGSPTVDEALAANLDDVCVGQDSPKSGIVISWAAWQPCTWGRSAVTSDE